MVNIQAIKTKFVDYPNILAHIEMLEKENLLKKLELFEQMIVDHAAGTISLDARGEHIVISLDDMDRFLKGWQQFWHLWKKRESSL